MKTITRYEDFSNYSSNYSSHGFWKTMAGAAKKLGSRTAYYALILYYTLESREVSLSSKAKIVAALGYLIAPVDLIPDAIPVLGLTDDAAAIKLAYNTVKASVTQNIECKASRKLCQWFGEGANC